MKKTAISLYIAAALFDAVKLSNQHIQGRYLHSDYYRVVT